MAGNQIDAVFTADTSALAAGVGDAVNLINSAFNVTRDRATQAKTPINELFKSLESSSNQAVAGIIRGTETWQKAVFNVATSLEIKFAQLAVDRLIGWLHTEALSLAATEAKNTAVQASDATAASAGAGASAAKLIKQIESDAAATYAGVYAFFSPVLGPAAAVPAAVSAGAVGAMEGLVSLDVGAWNVSQNMPAFLHAGEMVVPENFASGLRGGDGIGGGGDNYSITINAIDTQTGAQFLKNNASVIASALSAQARNFNRNVPTWKS
jgi:hypothetical protein